MSKKTVKTTKNTEATVTAPVTPAPANVGPMGQKAKTKKIAAAPAPVAAIAEPTSKRVTVGAAITEWRVVASQRKGMPGWFLQGGSYAMANGRNAFTVGAETFFEDRKEAAAALATKRQSAIAA
jgi:hypothetical protein